MLLTCGLLAANDVFVTGAKLFPGTGDGAAELIGVTEGFHVAPPLQEMHTHMNEHVKIVNRAANSPLNNQFETRSSLHDSILRVFVTKVEQICRV